jgi:hypothetical protein
VVTPLPAAAAVAKAAVAKAAVAKAAVVKVAVVKVAAVLVVEGEPCPVPATPPLPPSLRLVWASC